MAGGTWASYQGFPCTDVRFVRSRGIQASTSVVEIPASAELEVTKPSDAALAKPEDIEKPSFAGITDDAPPVPYEPGALLKPEGTLVMAWCDSKGVTRAVAVAGLFVLRVETVRATDGAVAFWRVYLVDERYFWTLGLMPRWSYNRRRGDGKSLAADSLQADGKTEWPLDKLVREEIAAKLFRSPTVAAMPGDWAFDTREWSFRHFQPAGQGVAIVVKTTGVEDVCFRLDRTVAFHEGGDGLTMSDGTTVPGFASTDANGVPTGANVTALPQDFRVWLKGTGQGRVLENGFPERYLVVTGGARIATVVLDSWEPVLIIHGKPVPLTESTIRTLTVGKYGLEWLHRWILQPPAHQHAVGVTQSVLDLLRSQAYRLYRLPGAVVYDDEAPTTNIDDPQGAVLPTGSGDASPGPNAHLLPLLRRAEIDGKGRLDVTIQTYRFQTQHRMFGDSPEQLVEQAASREIAELVTVIKDKADVKGKADPWNHRIADVDRTDPMPQFLEDQMAAEAANTDVIQLEPTTGFGAHVSGHDWELARREAINVDRIREIDPGDASKYESALKRKYAAQDKMNGTDFLGLYEIAKEFAKADPNRPPSALKAAAERIHQVDEKVGKQLAAKKILEDAGGSTTTPTGAVYYKNLERERKTSGREDPGDNALRLGGLFVRDSLNAFTVDAVAGDDLAASVHSYDLGIIRTGSLPGWLLDPNVHDAGSTVFVPKPVRVIFGAVVRPRTDRPMGAPRGTATGALTDGASPDVIPEVLSDRETYFQAAYERIGRGQAVPVDLAALPAPKREEVLRFAALLERPDLAELVPLNAEGNRNDLLAQALDAAKTVFRRPDVLRSETITMLGSWAVNCDGVVREIEIQMRHADSGAPCGFFTFVRTGSSAWRTPGQGSSSRPPRPRSSRDDDRERLRP